MITKEAALTNRMPSRDSVNQCFVTFIDRSTALPRATHHTVRLRGPSAAEQAAAGPGRVSASRDTSATSLFYYIRVDASGKTTQRVNCAIPNSEASYAAAVNTFSLDGYKGPKGASPPVRGGAPAGRRSGGASGSDAAEPGAESLTEGFAEPLSGTEGAEGLESGYEEVGFELGAAVSSPAAPAVVPGSEYDCYFDLYTEWVNCGSYSCQLLEDETYNCGEGCFINPSGQTSTDIYWYYDYFWDSWIVVSWEIVEYELSCAVHVCDEQTLIPSEWSEECDERNEPETPTFECSGTDVMDVRDSIRAEYDSSDIFTGQYKPACSEIVSGVQSPNGYFGWGELSANIYHGAGVFRSAMLSGADEVRSRWVDSTDYAGLLGTSFYRCPRKNADIGSTALGSRHMHGDAVDFDNPAYPDSSSAVRTSTWGFLYILSHVPGATVLTGTQDPRCSVECLHVDWR